MKTHRLFSLFVAVALLVLAVLTIRDAAATVSVISETVFVSQAADECASLPARSSIRGETVNGVWLPTSEDGPTGIDGGLIHLLAACGACSH
jgi:hypothetical protein